MPGIIHRGGHSHLSRQVIDHRWLGLPDDAVQLVKIPRVALPEITFALILQPMEVVKRADTAQVIKEQGPPAIPQEACGNITADKSTTPGD